MFLQMEQGTSAGSEAKLGLDPGQISPEAGGKGKFIFLHFPEKNKNNNN